MSFNFKAAVTICSDFGLNDYLVAYYFAIWGGISWVVLLFLLGVAYKQVSSISHSSRVWDIQVQSCVLGAWGGLPVSQTDIFL